MKVEMTNLTRSYQTEAKPEKIKLEAEKAAMAESKVEKEAPKSQETTEKENKKVSEIVEKMNKELKKVDTSIEFKVHETDGIGQNKISIKVVEKDSEKVIAEIPSEEAIEFAEKMEEITGLLFDHSR